VPISLALALASIGLLPGCGREHGGSSGGGDSGRSVDAPENRDDGDASAGDQLGGPGEAAARNYGIVVIQSGMLVEYREGVQAYARGPEDRTELDLFGAVTTADGSVDEITIAVAPHPRPGTYACLKGAVQITVRWLYASGAVFNLYDTYTRPGGQCSITLTEVGGGVGADFAGTFSGLLWDVNGGRLVLKDGRFRGRFAN
jgi:hypothetical protein